MRVALFTTFKTTRKDPLIGMLDRVSDAFMAAGLDPTIGFTLADSPLPGSVSAVGRAVKRFPGLTPFVSDAPVLPGGPPVHQLHGRPGAAGVAFTTLRELAGGIPRSLPFHTATFTFGHPEFGPPLGDPTVTPPPGVHIRDDWWVDGRMRSLTALTVVEVEPSHQGLLPVPAPVATIIGACGVVEGTNQVAMPEIPPAGASPLHPTATPQNSVAATVLRYRENFAAVLDRAKLPHELPPLPEALASHAGEISGPRKPALVRAFKPLGYDCTSKSGVFTLRRRTATNQVVEITLDVGSWSRMVSGFLAVRGPGVRATVPLPVGPGIAGQYPIGNAVRWQQIVDNLAALVRELERSFVPEVIEAMGPAPDWFEPGP